MSYSFEYTAAAVVGTFWLTAFQAVKVGRARKAAKVEYPQSASHVFRRSSIADRSDQIVVYAEEAQAKASKEAMIFNCTQRESTSSERDWGRN